MDGICRGEACLSRCPVVTQRRKGRHSPEWQTTPLPHRPRARATCPYIRNHPIALPQATAGCCRDLHQSPGRSRTTPTSATTTRPRLLRADTGVRPYITCRVHPFCNHNHDQCANLRARQAFAPTSKPTSPRLRADTEVRSLRTTALSPRATTGCCHGELPQDYCYRRGWHYVISVVRARYTCPWGCRGKVSNKGHVARARGVDGGKIINHDAACPCL